MQRDSRKPDINEIWRAGVASDAEAIAALTREAYAKWVPVIGRLPLPMQADYAAAMREHEFTLVEWDGALVGLIETQNFPDHLYIVNVAVAEAFQGRGLGRRLVAHAEQKARARGYRQARLMTNALYVENIRLYELLGFEVYARDPFENGVAVRMRKALR